jgi:hypothetical protein
MTEDQRKELKKREILTYARRNKIPVPPDFSSSTTRETSSISAEKISSFSTKKRSHPPLPPPVHDLLPKPTQTMKKFS